MNNYHFLDPEVLSRLQRPNYQDPPTPYEMASIASIPSMIRPRPNYDDPPTPYEEASVVSIPAVPRQVKVPLQLDQGAYMTPYGEVGTDGYYERGRYDVNAMEPAPRRMRIPMQLDKGTYTTPYGEVGSDGYYEQNGYGPPAMEPASKRNKTSPKDDSVSEYIKRAPQNYSRPSLRESSHGMPEMPTNLQDLIQLADLPVGSAKKGKGPSSGASNFAFYEPNPEQKAANMDQIKGDKMLSRDLHQREGYMYSLIGTLDKMSDEIEQNPHETLIPGTKAYNNMKALVNGSTEDARKVFGSGATFTESEMKLWKDQMGPIYGLEAAKQPGGILNPQQRVERLETAQDLLLRKLDGYYQSLGYQRRRVNVTGPDGRAISVDAFEAPRAARLARDPKKWGAFVDNLGK